MVILTFVIGLVLLFVGADLLVRGASRLAIILGLTPLVVGLTIVAFGTSAPEGATSIAAALRDQPDLALGNVIGSNIMNVLVVLGMAAMIKPLVVSRQLLHIDVPIMIAVSVLLYVFALNGVISRFESGILLLGIVVYTSWMIRKSRKESQRGAKKTRQVQTNKLTIARYTAFVLVGLVMLVFGAEYLVEAASTIARQIGLSELIIGLTVIAFGTSLPEIATSLMAAFKQERDIAIGNVIGSNISNVLMILGVTGLVAPNGISVAPAALNFDLPFMIAVAIACLPIFFTGHRIGRREGALLFGYYIVYVGYLVLDASGHDAQQTYSTVMFAFVTPLIFITLLTLATLAWRKKHRELAAQKQ